MPTKNRWMKNDMITGEISNLRSMAQVIDPQVVVVVLQGLVGHNPNLCLRKRKVVKTLPLTM